MTDFDSLSIPYEERQKLKNEMQHLVGKRIRCLSMHDPYSPIPPGTLGTVFSIDDALTIHVNWDTGSNLGLVFMVDSFEEVK
jgi:hypothetical protein